MMDAYLPPHRRACTLDSNIRCTCHTTFAGRPWPLSKLKGLVLNKTMNVLGVLGPDEFFFPGYRASRAARCSLEAQAEALCIETGDIVACHPPPAGEDNPDADFFWLLRADGPVHSLDAEEAEQLGGEFSEGQYVVSGRWFERRESRGASAADAAFQYVLGAQDAVYSHLVFHSGCVLHLVVAANSATGLGAVWQLDMREEARICSARRHHSPVLPY